ncbi:MAG: adenylate/guanylate cyclase domain-containing protein, partial [bacterium]|nr:adenylate/guanylate cyclase domain-containing protein [bacterium]
SRPDDPLRAVGAALKMMENLDTLNEERRAGNKPEIKIGIGINTGLAVAGNMGSEKRLNYTVLGESVNVAARLCSQAAPSEILISGNTYKKVAVDVNVKDHETLPMKGISKPLEVFKVKGLKKKSLKRLNGLFIFILLLIGISGGLWAEPSPGWSLVSRDGRFQVDIGGRLQLSGYLPGEASAYMIEETDPFVAGRLSLFTDIFLGKRLYGLVELRADRGEIPGDGPLKVRLQQAFLRYTFLSSFNLHVQVGKFVSPFGEYSQRHDTVADPFIRPPLL